MQIATDRIDHDERGDRETQQDIANEIAAMIPPPLLDRYRGYSYADMAEIIDLAEYADQLRSAEERWYQTGE